MAAYSAVAAFRLTLEQLLEESEQLPPHVSKNEIESLHEKIRSLRTSLDKIPFVPKLKRPKMKELQNKIREAIYAAQDKVEYWIRDHSPEKLDGETMKELVKAINLVEQEAVQMQKEISDDPKAQNLFSENTPEPSYNFSGKDKIVGQEEDFKKVTGWLQSEDKARLVIPITGLPGIGKTTLARSIYDDKQSRNHFNIRAWVTVSQDVNYQEVFSKILSSMESRNYQAGHYASQGDEHTLLNRLHQELYNLKYLIVVDDVWDPRVWDRVVQALPDKENGSRILLTTRIPAVADTVKQYGLRHEMQPLSLEHSWELLCIKVFGDNEEFLKTDIKKACPEHLKDTGRSIAEKCKGLPLSLVVVGGLLIQERVKIEYWKRIEEDTADAAATGEDSYLEILSLSYLYLPGKLKGCFLYMGAFPEDCEIRVTKLIKLWVAEGFLPKPAPAPASTPAPAPAVPNVEQVAQKSLEDLIGRNLLSIRKKSANGGMKACGMHDSLRELAEQESGMEKFFHARKKYNQEVKDETKHKRRVSVHRNILMCLEEVYESTKTITYARTLLYVGSHHHHPMPFFLTFDLLKVLDAFTCYFIQFPDEFLELVHLTYLSFTYNGKLPAKIAELKKLETLMVRREPKIIFVGASFLPDVIWEMPQLRHLWLTETDFPTLPSAPRNIVLLENLQTLSSVDAAYFTDEVLANMPNLRKLAMWIEAPDKINFTVAKLTKLEHFKFVVLNPIPGKGIEVEVESFFPKTLKRVTLSGTGLPWEYMRFLAEELKGLEVLKLKELAFNGKEWRPDYKLKELKYLLIEYLNFQKWEATNSDFPKLQRLILRHCYELEEVPGDLKYIGPLELIELVDCSPEAVASDVLVEDDDFDHIRINIFSSWE